MNVSWLQSIVMPRNPDDGPPLAPLYTPPLYPAVPIRLGERSKMEYFNNFTLFR